MFLSLIQSPKKSFRERSTMLKKSALITLLACAVLFAAAPVPTVLDSIKVPVPIIKEVSPTVFTGKITYKLTLGDNDSLNISLDFVPQNGGPIPVITYTDGTYGMIPMATGINGKNDIFFTATFPTAPALTKPRIFRSTESGMCWLLGSSASTR